MYWIAKFHDNICPYSYKMSLLGISFLLFQSFLINFITCWFCYLIHASRLKKNWCTSEESHFSISQWISCSLNTQARIQSNTLVTSKGPLWRKEKLLQICFLHLVRHKEASKEAIIIKWRPFAQIQNELHCQTVEWVKRKEKKYFFCQDF